MSFFRFSGGILLRLDYDKEYVEIADFGPSYQGHDA